MLYLSQQQVDALAATQWQTAVRLAAEHCRMYFQEVAAQLTDEELLQHLNRSLIRARTYGFVSERDVYRFLNLALEFGWDFDTEIRYIWMRKRLLDTRLATPSERLEWLVKRCIHRQKIEEENLAKLKAFAPSEVPVDIYDPKIRDTTDYEPVESILLFESYLPANESEVLLLEKQYADQQVDNNDFVYDEKPLLLRKIRRSTYV